MDTTIIAGREPTPRSSDHPGALVSADHGFGVTVDLSDATGDAPADAGAVPQMQVPEADVDVAPDRRVYPDVADAGLHVTTYGPANLDVPDARANVPFDLALHAYVPHGGADLRNGLAFLHDHVFHHPLFEGMCGSGRE